MAEAMQAMAAKLSDAEKVQVAEFIAGDSSVAKKRYPLKMCAGEAAAIRAALAKAMAANLAGATNPYGDGKTVPRILSVLTSLPERDTLMHKRFIDIEVTGG